MPGVFDKLNLKDRKEILVLDAPQSFEPALAGLRDVRIARTLAAVKDVRFALAFVTRKAQVERWAKLLTSKASGDAILWFAYPKGTSKRLQCDFNRDDGWDAVRAGGFDSVRQIAIDEDWSALRFRRAEFIKRRA